MNVLEKDFLCFDIGGGKGFIGQRLVQLLKEKGFQNVWIVSRKTDGKANTLTWVYLKNWLNFSINL